MASISAASKPDSLEFERILGSHCLQQRDLFGLADHVDQGNGVLLADAVKHLAQVRGRGGVDQRLKSLPLHRAGKTQRGHRIDETGAGIGNVGAIGDGDASPERNQGMAGEARRTRPAGDPLAHQRFGFRIVAGGDHRASAFDADQRRLADATGLRLHRGFGDRRDDPARRVVRVGKHVLAHRARQCRWD